MATTVFNPTSVTFTEFVGSFGAAGFPTRMIDNDPNTGYGNVYGTTAAFITFGTTTTPPANFTGSSVSSVQLYHAGNRGLPYGEWSMQVSCTHGSTSTGTQGPGISTGYTSALAHPGGGSWSASEFLAGQVSWTFNWHGNADGPSFTMPLEETNVLVTYTPTTAPTAAFTASTTTGTSPLTVNFTDQSTGSPTAWLWSFGDATTTNTQHPQHIYTTNATSTYTVTLTVTNGGGTDDEVKSSYITVDPSVAPVAANFTADPRTGVQNLGVQFYDGSTGSPAASSWSWAFGDGATSTEQNPLHTYTTIGVYTVTLTASNVTPTTDSEVKTSFITVADGRPVPLATVDTTTGLRPLDVQFTGSATNALPTTWNWDFGDGTGSVAQSPAHQYVTVGTYTPVLTVQNGIGTATTTCGPITVLFQTITAGFTACPLMGYAPLTVRFSDTSSGDAFSWAWQFGDIENSTGVGEFPVHTYFEQGSGESPDVTMTVTQTGYSQPPALRDNLTNYWKMEESTGTTDRADFISTNDLDTAGGTFTQVTGKHDFAVRLRGTPQALNSENPFSNTPAWSFSGWFNLEAIAANQLQFFGFTAGANDAYFDVTSGGLLRLNNTGETAVTGTTVLSASTWYHFVWTWDGVDKYKLYLNGALEATLIGTAATSAVLTIQTGASAASGFYLDELARYSTNLSEQTILEQYNNGDGVFFEDVVDQDTEQITDLVCVLTPDRSWGYFFEELKYVLMENMCEQTVCEGFDDFGGIAKAVELTQNRLKRFVLETAALRTEALLSTAAANSENFALPADLIELLRVEVDGVPHYPSDRMQNDFDSGALSTYYQNDALSITIPGTFGTVPVTKVQYTYVPTPPDVPSPCDCQVEPNMGPWPAFPIPYVLWWIIRYGVMADMFSQAGERNDPQRALKCEEMFNTGTQLYKFLYRGSN